MNDIFPGQESNEKVLLIIKKHWFSYLIFGLVAFLTGALLITLILILLSSEESPSLVSHILAILVPVYLLSVLGLLMYGFIDYHLDSYVVTNKRVVDVKQNGLFKRQISELNMQQVEDVKANEEGVFSTILNFGDVVIQTAGESDNFIFHSIPHPYETAKKIIDLHQKALGTENKKDEQGKDPKLPAFTSLKD